MVNAFTTIGDAAPLTNWPVGTPPTRTLTMKMVIAAPPLLAGGVNVTVACAFPATAVTAVGAPGLVTGVTVFDAPEAGPVPTLLVAVTVKVYAVPLVRPGTTIGEAAPVAVMPPGLEVTVKLVIGAQAGSAQAGAVNAGGEVNDTVAWPLPAAALAPVGAVDTVAEVGVTLFDAAEGAPVSRAALVALTVKV